MSHDYSRVRHDARDHYQGVLLQQGRPLTDSDWNEAVAQSLRRGQADSLDTFGPAVVPATTPDAFLVVPTLGGFTLGTGRLYVDGLLAENHGTGALAWEPRMEQLVGGTATPYAAQPYWPAPPALPALPYAVVLDVWQREVGPWQDERLLEPALGGVDTTARVQTVWQVSAQAVAAGSTCASPWTPPPPSDARLSSAAVLVPGAPNPCLVPPGGGYQGGENQLYRIEVHDGGPLGTATFKWSRDNASVQARVVNIPDLTHLVVDSVGRDDVLRFGDGDWLEILDDRLELQGQATTDGAPGLLRQIIVGGGVDDATRTITLAQALPAGTFPVDAQGVPIGGLHCRIRRWDQSGQVRRADGTVLQDLNAAGSTGAIVVPAAATQVVLEDGVAVSFGVAVAGGRLRSGDWWAVAARTSDASVEILTDAPPRGVHHHHAKLAIVTATGVLDCRTPWPPTGGCCTIVVAPGQSIQAAIDALPVEGGCVCLKNGLHTIAATVEITRPNIKLHGEAPGTRVSGSGLAALLVVSATTDVEVAQIEFEAPACPPGAILVGLLAVERVQLRDCSLRYQGAPPSDCIGVGGAWCSDIVVTDCRFDRCATGLLTEIFVGPLRVASCVVEAQMDGGAAPVSLTSYGLLLSGGSVDVQGNRFVDCHTAVSLQRDIVGARVCGNRVERRALPAALDVEAALDDMLWAVEAFCDAARIEANRIEVPSIPHGGVLVRGERVMVHGNHLRGGEPVSALSGPIGVVVGADPAGLAGQAGSVEANQFEQVLVAVLVRQSAEVALRGNTVRNATQAGRPYGFGLVCDGSRGSLLSGNALQDVALPFLLLGGSATQVQGNTVDRAGMACAAIGEADLEFSQNRIDDTQDAGVFDLQPEGTHRYLGNRLRFCGWDAASAAFGLALLNFTITGTLIVQDNEILDTGVHPTTGFGGAAAVGIGAGLVLHALVAGNRIAYPQERQKLNPALPHRALALIGPPALGFSTGAGTQVVAIGSAQIQANQFVGPGRPHLVELVLLDLGAPAPSMTFDTRFARVGFAHNHLEHDETPDASVTVSLRGGQHLAVQGNHQTAGPLVGSVHLANRPQAVVLGNVTTGDFQGVAGGTVPAPLASFNVNL